MNGCLIMTSSVPPLSRQFVSIRVAMMNILVWISNRWGTSSSSALCRQQLDLSWQFHDVSWWWWFMIVDDDDDGLLFLWSPTLRSESFDALVSKLSCFATSGKTPQVAPFIMQCIVVCFVLCYAQNKPDDDDPTRYKSNDVISFRNGFVNSSVISLRNYPIEGSYKRISASLPFVCWPYLRRFCFHKKFVQGLEECGYRVTFFWNRSVGHMYYHHQ